jgi:hypothetical protein
VGWGWALPAVLFSALTVALAIWASLPRDSLISPGDLEQVNAYFTEQIKYRTRYLRASALTLCFALLCLPLPFIASAWESSDPTLSLTASRDGNAISIHARAQHIDDDATLSVLLRAHHSFPRTLGHSSGTDEGRAELDISLPRHAVPPCSKLLVRVAEDGRLTSNRLIKLGRGLSAPRPMQGSLGGHHCSAPSASP